jgi:hypothetical protein
MAQAAATLADAFDIARRATSTGDLIAVTGSFFLAGEARKMLQDRVEKMETHEAELGIARPLVARLAGLRRT